MIERFLITGDTHSDFSRFEDVEDKKNYTTAVIILGDAGVNYYLNKKDRKNKEIINKMGFVFYLVRGNHEERPENIKGMERVYDAFVDGPIYIEREFENIRYFVDGGIYDIMGHRTLIIGGAYSVDKYYRLSQGWIWYASEQLTLEERESIYEKVKGQEFDFVFSHTCPRSFMPTELFIKGINQDEVDITMESWLDDIKLVIKYKIWFFGHFHADKPIIPGKAYLLSTSVRPIEEYYDFCMKYPNGIFGNREE